MSTPTASTSSPPTSTSSTLKQPSQLKANLSYLIKGNNSLLKPKNLSTRTSLRTTRYVFIFVMRRLLRYFKYAMLASGATLLAGTMLGTALPFLAAIAVPSVPVSIAIGLTTTAIKFTWRHRGNHFRQAWISGGKGDAVLDESRDAAEAEGKVEFDFDRERRRNRGERDWGFQ